METTGDSIDQSLEGTNKEERRAEREGLIPSSSIIDRSINRLLE
jgi:hypothetical protein